MTCFNYQGNKLIPVSSGSVVMVASDECDGISDKIVTYRAPEKKLLLVGYAVKNTMKQHMRGECLDVNAFTSDELGSVHRMLVDSKLIGSNESVGWVSLEEKEPTIYAYSPNCLETGT
ncbi:MAG: hypothetical protein ABIG84_05820 [archaeon]